MTLVYFFSSQMDGRQINVNAHKLLPVFQDWWTHLKVKDCKVIVMAKM